MGKVTEELVALITKQVQDHGLVVWYDPEPAYGDVVDQLSLPETTVLRYQGSFFALRHLLEPFLEFVDDAGTFHVNVETPPRVLIDVPLDRARTQHALIEAEAAGVVMEPGGSPWQRNTRLKVLAERVFKRLAPDRASAIAAEVEAGRRTLAELDWLADQTGELGAVKLIFGTTAVADVVLTFLSSDAHDQAILNKHALPELASLFATELGLSVNAEQPVDQARHQLCRSLLLAELILKASAAGGDTAKLATVPIPETVRQREQLLAVCQQWRNRLDLRESYATWANTVQTEAHVLGLGLHAPALTDVETFACVESLLLDWVEARILDGAVTDALAMATRRKASFWSLYAGEYQLQWTLLELAAQLLLAAERIEAERKIVRKDARAIMEAYTRGLAGTGGAQALPWCVLDRYHRHLEHRYALLDLRPEGQHAQLETVMPHVRRRYAEIIGQCAESLAEALVLAGFEVDGLLRQDEAFRKQVRSRATEGKMAYVLVDALRYEMGQELVEGLGDEFDIRLVPAIAQLPTITEVGMAALMPGADQGMELVDVGTGRVGVRIGDALLKDRASRVKHFQSKVEGQPVVLKLNDLMKPTKKRLQEISEADILLTTSQEIDRRGEETEDEEEARRFMDEVLEKLRRGIRRLAALGVQNIVIAADHGYLFVEEVDDAMKIDPPGGQTVDLHARVWVGRGGRAAPGYVRVLASQLGLAGDLELAFPLGLACFRSRGSSRGYCHGGISFQELMIPVAAITVRAPRATPVGTTTVLLTLAKPKITTRFFSVEARYVVGGLFGDDTKRVRVVVRANRTDVGVATMAAYGFEEGTQEIVLAKDRPNAITMMLTTEVETPTVSVHVLDAATHVEFVSQKNIPVEIAI
jgi:hypothetical protein